MGTQITVYIDSNFDPSYGKYSFSAPFPSSKCINFGGSFTGNIGSLVIKWNVRDSSSNHLVCAEVGFWLYSDCRYTYLGYDIPGGQVSTTKYDYADTSDYELPYAIYSVSCLKVVSPPSTSPPPVRKKSPPPFNKRLPPPPSKRSPPYLRQPPFKKPPPLPPFRRLPPPLQKKPPPPKVLHSDCLDPHNAARKAVGVPDIAWSDEIAKEAQSWANYLASIGCPVNHGGNDMYGQNLDSSNPPHTCTEAVNRWVAEKAHYHYGRFPNYCDSGYSCGHYTQVVWKDTQFVGCGTARCGDSAVLVCDYYPPGNYLGEYPY